ncbi:MAG: VWA domain-containing protein [Phycisphaerales bacterium]
MDITFDNPAWLWLGLLAIPMAVMAIRDFRAAMSTYRAWSAAIARALLIALIATILAGASSVRETKRLAVVAVIDISDSMRLLADQYSEFGNDAEGNPRSYREAVLDYLARSGQDRTPEDLLGVVVFAGSSMAVSIPSASTGPDIEIEYQLVDGSNIDTALRFAQRMFPPDAARRIVLVSDGVETGGDALRAASELASSPTPVRVDVVPVTYRVRSEVMVEAIDAPPRSTGGATIPVRVVLGATEATSGTVNLRYNGELLDISPSDIGNGRRVSLREGRNIVILQVPLQESDVLHRLEVAFTPDDPAQDRVLQNNRAETVVTTESRGTVLIVDGRADRAAAANPLVATLEGANIPVRSVSPRDVGRTLDELNAYDLIILQDVAAGDVPPNPRAARGLREPHGRRAGDGRRLRRVRRRRLERHRHRSDPPGPPGPAGRGRHRAGRGLFHHRLVRLHGCAGQPGRSHTAGDRQRGRCVRDPDAR